MDIPLWSRVFVAEEMTIQFEMARNASKYPLGEDKIAEIMCDLVAKRGKGSLPAYYGVESEGIS